MASSKRRRTSYLSEEDIRQILENEDLALSDTEPDYPNDDSDDDIEVQPTNVDDFEEDITSDDEDVTVVNPHPIRKNVLPSLSDTINEENYDPLPLQTPQTYRYTSRDKQITYSWTTEKSVVGRRGSENVIRNKPGPERSVARDHEDITPLEAFELFFTDNMITNITECTNKKIDVFRDKYGEKLEADDKITHIKPTTPNEIRAFLGLMYMREAMKLNLRNIHDVFYHKSSNDSFRATMSRKRFSFFCVAIQFDDASSRQERWKEDRFTAIRDIFEGFNHNCAKARVPSEYLAIDETLYPYRGSIKLRQYNPNKPAKYGLLYRSILDSTIPYTYFTLPYAGKPEAPNQYYVTGTDKYTEYFVESLKKQVDISGRNISMDRYFTSVSIAKYLLANKITLVGTMRSGRVGIPNEMKEIKQREDLFTMYAFTEDNKLLLVSYVVKKKSGKRNVLVLSTMHKDVKVTKDARLKPHVIAFYDRTKGGVDVMDMIAGNYTTKFKTRRWTMNTLAYILDTAKTNSLTIFRDLHPNTRMSSFEFVWDLTQSLIKSHVVTRQQNPLGLQQPSLAAIK